MGELPPIEISHPHVEARPDLLSGSPVVRGTKVPVRRLWNWHRKGVTVETLIKRYPLLGPARVCDALSFAYDNEQLIEADMEREQNAIDAECSTSPPLPGTQLNAQAQQRERWLAMVKRAKCVHGVSVGVNCGDCDAASGGGRKEGRP